MIEVTIERRHMFVIAAVIAVVGLLVPVAVWATDRFNDVPVSNVFHADIEWLADAGITKGCNPPLNTEFCPTAAVTREQMSAFMHRLALSQSVDAGLVQGFTAEELKGAIGDPGPRGSEGPAGPQGPPGADGATHAGAAIGGEGLAGTGLPIVRGGTTIFDQTYDKPAGGVLLCLASTTLIISHTNGTTSFVLLRLNDLFGGSVNPGGTIQIPSEAPTGTYRFPVSVHTTGRVDGGANRCILEAEPSVGTSAVANGGSMVAIYTPDFLRVAP